jgi:hypothetical protein
MAIRNNKQQKNKTNRQKATRYHKIKQETEIGNQNKRW